MTSMRLCKKTYSLWGVKKVSAGFSVARNHRTAVCFEMESFTTPKKSSVFMTPFSSVRKRLFCSPQVPPPAPLPFTLLSPAENANISLELEHKDILSELYEGGLPLVAENIFSYLAPGDLCMCLQVCKTWNHQVSSDTKFMNKVYSYRKQCKENAENLHKTNEIMQFTVSPTQRRPLASFTPNTMSQILATKTTPVSFKSIKYWHEGECSRTMNPSKRQRQSEAICGTKKCTSRLRRL